MPSPFPGMDPYLEAHWRDIHPGLVVYASDALQGLLPVSLRARVDERMMRETVERSADYRVVPDVRVVEYPIWGDQGVRPRAEHVAARPLVASVEPRDFAETCVKIIDIERGNRVVTVIEFLSPSNKSLGVNREQYLRKQREICSLDSNLAEIDLVRSGAHTLAFPLDAIPSKTHTSYMACVRRATRRRCTCCRWVSACRASGSRCGPRTPT
jgi:hypothetical protein